MIELNKKTFKDVGAFNQETNTLEKQFCVDLYQIIANINKFDFPASSTDATLNIIQKGDKSKQIEKLQSLLSLFLQKEYSNMGAYDAETYVDSKEIFNGTSLFVDEKLGAISNEKLNELSIFILNLLNLTK